MVMYEPKRSIFKSTKTSKPLANFYKKFKTFNINKLRELFKEIK